MCLAAAIWAGLATAVLVGLGLVALDWHLWAYGYYSPHGHVSREGQGGRGHMWRKSTASASGRRRTVDLTGRVFDDPESARQTMVWMYSWLYDGGELRLTVTYAAAWTLAFMGGDRRFRIPWHTSEEGRGLPPFHLSSRRLMPRSGSSWWWHLAWPVAHLLAIGWPDRYVVKVRLTRC